MSSHFYILRQKIFQKLSTYQSKNDAKLANFFPPLGLISSFWKWQFHIGKCQKVNFLCKPLYLRIWPRVMSEKFSFKLQKLSYSSSLWHISRGRQTPKQSITKLASWTVKLYLTNHRHYRGLIICSAIPHLWPRHGLL